MATKLQKEVMRRAVASEKESVYKRTGSAASAAKAGRSLESIFKRMNPNVIQPVKKKNKITAKKKKSGGGKGG